ncbi:MAG: UDP-N-acetylmuramate--L-alanine ligase [Patescibacteria group bacterium]|jgi:UDP-N-acetylmuramate--alanine ligase
MSKSFQKNKVIYFLGVKGVGMTMLAQFLAKQGNFVSGSDISDIFLTDKVLRRANIKVTTPFAAQNIPATVDLIIYSSAYNVGNNSEMLFIKNNPERFKNIPVLSYAAALGAVFNQYYGLAVCGSHGKTTTSAWLGYVLWQAGKRPNVLVGSAVPQFGGSGLQGSSRYLVAEVDEYQNKLQYFFPRGVVLNNIDYDHPDFFKTPADYVKVFADFIKKIPPTGFLVLNNHDKNIKKIKKYCRASIISYDLADNEYGAGADYLAYDLKAYQAYQIFSVSYHGYILGEFKISLGGEHNVFNALAVIAAARRLKVPLPKIKKHLAGFLGTRRRAEILGRYRGAVIIDDYAHHPTEIKTTLLGLRARYGSRNLITVFHPHTFTRTKALFKNFVESFSETDELIILDIYGSAREKQGGVSSRELVAAVNKFNKIQRVKQRVKYIATTAQATVYLRKKLKNTDVLLLMGAGDVFRVGEGLLKKV